MNTTRDQFSWIKVSLHAIVWFSILYIINAPFINLELGPFTQSEGTLLVPTAYGMVFNAILFYLNAYHLIPRYLHNKDNKGFWAKSVFWIVCLSTVECIFDLIYLSQIDTTGITDIIPTTQTIILEAAALLLLFSFINVLYWGAAFLYRLPFDWIQNERFKNQLIQDKLSAELELLKAQINPHFLFNGINSIYHLIGYNDNVAKDILLKFSGLLRYQLYECNEEFIPLSKELEYVINYIKLEEIRKGEDAYFDIELPDADSESLRSLTIAPLLFTPFLENAFKFMSLYSEKEKNKLDARIHISNGVLDFQVRNTINHEMINKQKKEDGGIGLENVKRRLKILYADNYDLSLSNENNTYTVKLKLHLA
ncbi:MAG TPA: DUF645 family protein [Cyclobacteriaceae bacterium]|nr:DUF645 family protein [Cyclobacteriaceae bacterium]